MSMPREGGTARTAAPHIFEAPVEVKDGRGQFLKKPAMTTAFRNAIPNPRAGMAIFNTDTLQEEFYDGTIWKQSAGGGGPTLMVAASNALASTIARADYQCDGVADEVEINLALAACDAGPGGRVLLSEGTFTLATPIVFPGNDLTLFGMGFNTFIDGDGLLTGNHAIELVGRTNCTLEEFSIQTQDGGGKVCYCIFLNDGCNGFRISGVTIVDSDHNAIHIEGTTVTDGWITNCEVMDADGSPLFIDIDGGNNADRIHIINNTFAGGDGNQAGIDIEASGGNRYFEIIGNIVRNNIWYGIDVEDLTYSVISDNDIYLNNREGLRLVDSSANTIAGNDIHQNGRGGIRLVTDCDGNVITGNNIYGNGTAGVYHGIVISVSLENVITGNQVSYNNYYGIYIQESSYCTVTGNVVSHNVNDGVHVLGAGGSVANYNNISDNIINENGDEGIELEGGANCLLNTVMDNKLVGNVGNAIVDAGNDTVLAEVLIMAPNTDANIGEHAGQQMLDAVLTDIRMEIPIPSGYQELVRVHVILVAAAAGDLYWSADSHFAKICAVEDYNTHTDAIVANATAVLINDLTCIDIAALLTGIDVSDWVGVKFTRLANNVLDTIGANVYLLGIRLQYV